MQTGLQILPTTLVPKLPRYYVNFTIYFLQCIKHEQISGAEKQWPVITNLIEFVFLNNCRNIQQNLTGKLFMLYLEVLGQSDPSTFLGITVQGYKSREVFASKGCME